MKRILVVEDDGAIRRSLETVLTSSGFLVAEAANGREALAAYDPGKFDAVVLDIIMPEMEGLETLRALQRISPGVKVLAISGGGQISADDHLSMAKKLGAGATLEKPFTGSAILNALDRLLGSSSLRANRPVDGSDSSGRSPHTI
ncbi:MAG: response regulator [Verrucomicrobia bacterium]|nr:response regulator [Verrucomicrobiota bacterium]